MPDNQNDEQKTKKKSSLAVVSLGFGFAALISLFLVMPPFIATLPALAGLIFGILALVQIKRKDKNIGGREYAIFGIIVGFIGIATSNLFFVEGQTTRLIAYRVTCEANLHKLGKAMLVYAQDNDEQFPEPDKWCDLLLENNNIQKKFFICKGGMKADSHYAINPNAEPNSPDDVVLLFETTGGWNQFGGPELITAENHHGKGCNVAFVGGYTDFVLKEDFEKLNWGDEKAMNDELVNNE